MTASNNTMSRQGSKSAGGQPAAAGAAAGEGKTPTPPAGDGKAATPPAGDGKAAPQPDSGELTVEQVQQMISKSLTESLRTELPQHLKGQVTEDSIKQIIAAEFAKQAKDSTTVKAEDLSAIVNGSVKAQLETFRKEKKDVGAPGDANNPDRGPDGRVEYGDVSWRKGNLPVHGKQLMNLMMKRHQDEGIDKRDLDRSTVLGEKTLTGYQRKAAELERHGGKALTSTGAGTGDEFVPTDLSSELQRRFFLASDLAAVMMSREIVMPTQPYELPLATTRPSFYHETVENTDATGSNLGTGKVTLDAQRMVGMVEVSYELEEDSIIPILPLVQQMLAEAAKDAWEHALINGDTTATHQDTDEELLTKSPAFAIKGFRKLANAIAGLKSDLTSGGLNEANLRAVRKLLKKYAADPRKLIWLCSAVGALDLQGIANVSTLEKYGPKATILTGELATLFGIPIVASERVRTDLDATGVNGASGNTKGSILLIRPDMFLTGRRREFMVEVDKNIKAGTHQIVASFRRAFSPVETPSATITTVAHGYNFTP